MTDPNPSTEKTRRPVRTGTIVWGSILLLVAALAYGTTLIDPSAYSPAFVAWSIVGFGGLLVITGLVGALLRAANGRARSASPIPVDRDAETPRGTPLD